MKRLVIVAILMMIVFCLSSCSAEEDKGLDVENVQLISCENNIATVVNVSDYKVDSITFKLDCENSIIQVTCDYDLYPKGIGAIFLGDYNQEITLSQIDIVELYSEEYNTDLTAGMYIVIGFILFAMAMAAGTIYYAYISKK